MQLGPAPMTPNEAGSELVLRGFREVAEVALKFVSWNIMLAAVEYTAAESHTRTLIIAEWVIRILLFMYLGGHIFRLENTLFASRRLATFCTLRFYTSLILMIIMTYGLYIGSMFLSIAIVKAIVDLQLHS